MKKYNKPVVEINSFDVEDIITVSIAFGGDEELQAVYSNFVGGAINDSDKAIVIEW